MSTSRGFLNAVAYPHVDPSIFTTNFVVDVSGGVFSACNDDVRVSATNASTPIDHGLIDLPTYDIAIGEDEAKEFAGRIAVMAIGSNSSPEILLRKLAGQAGGQALIMQAEMHDHAVVHGAFIGAAGSVPATVMPHRNSKTRVTVGFFTKDQFAALTTTEPNYDVVQSGFAPILRQGAGTRLTKGAAMYVSPWGALTLDGASPIALEDIPSTTDLLKLSSRDVVNVVSSILGQADAKAFFDTLPNASVADRLHEIFKLQERNALPASIDGQAILKASIGPECEKIGRIFPALRYGTSG